MRPKNFRTHRFHLFGKDITIGGMAGLHNNLYRNAVLKYLRDIEGRVVLISLHESYDYTALAKSQGIEFYHKPLFDFESTPIPPAVYDAIYAIVKKSTAEGKQVSISCGAGDGRTGTALACLKLRELLERAAKINPLVLDYNPNKTASVRIPMGSGGVPKNVKCTPLVQEAVDGVRAHRISSDNSGSNSVETVNDINTLIAYETHLRLVIKAELTSHRDKVGQCIALLERIRYHGTIGSNDVLMNKFINDNTCEIHRADDLDKISKVYDALTVTLHHVQDDASLQKIKEKIEMLRMHRGSKSREKKARATLIEDALSLIPVNQRHDLTDSKTKEAIHLNKAMRSLRFTRSFFCFFKPAVNASSLAMADSSLSVEATTLAGAGIRKASAKTVFYSDV